MRKIADSLEAEVERLRGQRGEEAGAVEEAEEMGSEEVEVVRKCGEIQRRLQRGRRNPRNQKL